MKDTSPCTIPPDSRYRGAENQLYRVEIHDPGPAGTATFKWSNDGGLTFLQTGVGTSTSPVALSDGVTISFQAGNFAGVNDFNLGDTFWIWAGPLRNQPVWIDLYVPMGTPAGNYTGTVTVTQTGKPPTLLTVNLQVYGFAIPVSASLPTFISGYWNGLIQVHYNVAFGPQTRSLGLLYGTACLINRFSCAGDVFVPTYTFNANGTVARADYSGYLATIGPLMDGTITPHGEQQTTIDNPAVQRNDTQTYFAMQNYLSFLVSRGWRSRLFDYTKDEPHSATDFLNLMLRASVLRSVDDTVRTLSTMDASQFNFNTVGYVTRYVPIRTDMGDKDYHDGPHADQRAFYDPYVANGTDVWWYDSCITAGCAGQGSPFVDNYPNTIADTTALMARIWGLMTLVPYRLSGYLYYGNTIAYQNYFMMPVPRVDLWDSIFTFGGNGDGSFFYPGRPSATGPNQTVIGGTTHIPVESIRIKQYRDAEVDIEYGLRLIAQGDTTFLQSNALTVISDAYTYNPDPAALRALRVTLGQRIH